MGIKIGDISSVNNLLTNEKKSNNESNQLFEDIYKAAIGLVNDTNNLQKNADKVTTDFAAGKTDNFVDVLIASEKATVALQYTVKLRDKVLDAYNEIMRMQV
ncbi:MAG: flagellar hook-basal body complex protein FliE [Vallitalea sp.]|jgi:flagellar hook-basal body complex protein FliE|nr:flagellar hook-basal body complex protein FliE [Vallitalea sp.]